MIVCTRPLDTFRDSMYRIGNKRVKQTAFPQALSKLTEMGDDVDTATNKLKGAFFAAVKKSKNPAKKSIITTPNTQSFWIFEDLRFTVLDGVTMFFIKTRDDVEQYMPTDDPMATAMEIRVKYKTKSGKTTSTNLYTKIQKRYEQVISANKLFLGRMENKEDEEGNAYIIAQPLSAYWETTMKQYFCKEERFMIKMPTTISSDVDEPTFFYFNEDELEGDIEPTDWLNWEKNLIPAPFIEAFRALVYAPYDPENNGRQAVWLYDGGFSGKSTVLSVMGEAMGRAHGAVSSKGLSDKFSYSKLHGKRLVTYGDNTNPILHKSEVFHSLLGGDIVDVENKHKKSFSGKMHAKVFIAANCPPKVDLSRKNEATRLVPIPLNTPPDEYLKGFCAVDSKGDLVRDEQTGEISLIGDSTFSARLRTQFGAYLKMYCKKAYQALCKNRSNVYLNSQCREIIRDDCGSDLQQAQADFVKEYLYVHFEGSPLPKTYYNLPMKDLKERYLDYLSESKEKVSDFSFGEFTRYLKDVYGVTTKSVSYRNDRGVKETKSLFIGIIFAEEYEGALKEFRAFEAEGE
jgi:hypothetical protein